MKELKKSKAFWLSYDLGIKGDYSTLYRWLDKNKAKECGDSIAFFNFICSSDNPKEEIKDSLLSENIQFNNSDRIYLIWRDDTLERNKWAFIVGNRKTAPWEWYFITNQDENFDF